MTSLPSRFAQVSPNIYRGGAPSPEQVKLLKQDFHINSILSLDKESGERIKSICKELNIAQIILPITPDSVLFLKRHIKSLLETNPPTYIHCFHGKDRSGLAIAYYRMANGSSKEEAFNEAKQFGYNPSGFHDDINPAKDKQIRHRKRKLRRQYLEDINNAMALVGAFDNVNPMLRGFGPFGGDYYGFGGDYYGLGGGYSGSYGYWS